MREPLPLRRASETFELKFGGLAMPHTITIGYYDDGRIGELFINGGKSGEVVEAIARDSAVIVSMALQHGVPIETIAHAITRDSQGAPQTIVGAVIDILTRTSSAPGKSEPDHETGRNPAPTQGQGGAAVDPMGAREANVGGADRQLVPV